MFHYIEKITMDLTSSKTLSICYYTNHPASKHYKNGYLEIQYEKISQESWERVANDALQPKELLQTIEVCLPRKFFLLL